MDMVNSAGNPVYSKPFQRYSRLRHEKTNWTQPKTRPKMVRASNRKSALSLWSWSLSDAKKNNTQCQLDANDWLDHSFLVPGLVFWYWNWKRVLLWMWSLGGSQQPFPCVLGHFQHGDDEQTPKQPGDLSASVLLTSERQSLWIIIWLYLYFTLLLWPYTLLLWPIYVELYITWDENMHQEKKNCPW